jgi:uncharacterized membrane protein YphA (DoxX/SURF4 family)
MRTSVASTDRIVTHQTTGMDAGLLLLRIGAGASLLLMFGIPKIRDSMHAIQTLHQWSFVEFNRRLGLPFPNFVAYCQTLNESVGASFVAVGLLTRLASGVLALGFFVATCCSLKARESAWMLASGYCLMFATLLLAGPGKFSIDRLLKSHDKSNT